MRDIKAKRYLTSKIDGKKGSCLCVGVREGEKKRDRMGKSQANPFTSQLKDFHHLSKG